MRDALDAATRTLTPHAMEELGYDAPDADDVWGRALPANMTPKAKFDSRPRSPRLDEWPAFAGVRHLGRRT